MKINEGLLNGAVLQRVPKKLCSAIFSADVCGDISVSLGNVEKIGDSLFELTGIPAGGPYNITLSDNNDSVSLEIYVGDIWLLGGQSNMDGIARIRFDDLEYAKNPTSAVRGLYIDGTWAPAKYDIHNKLIATETPYIKSVENWLKGIADGGKRTYDAPPYPIRCCVGPGVSFAREMYRLTGVPQGIISAAVGGAQISMWLPENGENYYTAAVNRIRLAGGRIKGMFWAQGEGEPNFKEYPEKFEKIRRAICAEFNLPSLPSVIMQSFVCTMEDDTEESSFRWSRFREMQRTMQCDDIATLATNDCSLEDGIHLDSPSQEKIGIRGARAMLQLTDGIGFAQPQLDKIIVEEDDIQSDTFSLLRIRYKNISGSLCSSSVPTGFEISENNSDRRPTKHRLCRMSLHQNEVHLRVERTKKELLDYSLWYGFGHFTYCNICDGEGRAIPSMGPIKIGDFI